MSDEPNFMEMWKRVITERQLVDVRSPAEYAKGHVPGAISLPLFSDEERATIGTLYKSEGHRVAFSKGLECVSDKLPGLLTALEQMELHKKLAIYCWRGGQRSGSLVWLARQAQLDVIQLPSGYKGFRRICQQLFEYNFDLRILGGTTGSGKTTCLITMKAQGHQVIDLEALANHTGSVFGDALGGQQPSQEHFENLLGRELMSLSADKPLWIEDESRFIGRIMIPDPLFKLMQLAPITILEQPIAQRVSSLCDLYGKATTEQLCLAVDKISKRLGGERSQAIKALIGQGKLHEAAADLLSYYDKAYWNSLNKRNHLICH